MNRSWVEISLPRLAWNIESIRSRIPSSTRVMAVVKADAYGHGVVRVSEKLFQCGIRDFAVATVEEAVALRRCVPEGVILVLGGGRAQELEQFRKHSLTAAVFDERVLPPDIGMQVKIDTGMGRLGIPWEKAARFVPSCPGTVQAVFSHFAASAEDPEFTRLQLRRFLSATQGLGLPRHISDSGGLQYPEAHLEAVRLGLSLYGVSPCPEVSYVRPVLCWKTLILTVREVPEGSPIGYGGTFVTRRPSRIAVLPVGYADGYNRRLSNRGQVLVGGRLAPVVGRISMDLTTIDVTDLPGVEAEQEVVLLDSDPQSPISAASLARTLETVPYEVLTSIGPRVRRVYV